MRPPRPCGSPDALRQRRGHDAAAPDHAVGLDRGAVGEVDVAGSDPGDGDAEVQAHALAAEDLGDVVVRLVGERAEERVAEVDDVHLRGRHREVAELRRQRVVDHVRRAHRRARRRSGRRRRRRSSARRRRSGPGCGRRPRRRRGSASAGAWRRRASRAGTHAPPRPGCGRSSGCEPGRQHHGVAGVLAPVGGRDASASPGRARTTSSSLTSTFARSWNKRRSEKAMSAGASWQVATW